VIGAAAVAIFFLCIRSRKAAAPAQPGAVPAAVPEAKHYRSESESMSPQSPQSGWGSASPATLNDAMFRHPDPRMSPPPMSGNQPAAMYMPQPMHQMPMHQAPQQYPGQEAYHPPAGGATELGGS
jgi:hypothetical protein